MQSHKVALSLFLSFRQALLDLEKTNGHGKLDRLAAVRAERLRHSTKADYRRHQNLAAVGELRERERELLVMKHAIPSPPLGTFGLPDDADISSSADS